jgi:hypothetical protein
MAKIVSVSDVTYTELVNICKAEGKEADEMVKSLIHQQYIQLTKKPKKKPAAKPEPKEEAPAESEAPKHSGRFPGGSKEEPTD